MTTEKTTPDCNEVEELGVPLLTAQVDEVKVVLNPSVLLRLMGNEYNYYFCDDIPVPYKELLERERVLLPSQRTDVENGKDGNVDPFGRVWIQFCARLANYQAGRVVKYPEYKSVVSTCAVFYLVLLANGLLCYGFLFGSCSQRYLYGQIYLDLIPVYVLHVLMLLFPEDILFYVFVRWWKNEDPHGRIQEIVDDMSPDFLAHGYNIDFVHDSKNFPTSLYFVRVATSSSAETTKNKDETRSLMQRMQEAQTRARLDHEDALITKQQEKRQTDIFMFGIPTKTVVEHRKTVVGAVFGFGFFCFAIMFMIFSSARYY